MPCVNNSPIPIKNTWIMEVIVLDTLPFQQYFRKSWTRLYIHNCCLLHLKKNFIFFFNWDFDEYLTNQADTPPCLAPSIFIFRVILVFNQILLFTDIFLFRGNFKFCCLEIVSYSETFLYLVIYLNPDTFL